MTQANGGSAGRFVERFADKVALITGAASGIGRSVCERLAGEGAKLFGIDINSDGLAETESIVKEAGGTMQSAVFDVTSRANCFEAVKATVDVFGKLDVLVNNAGVSQRHNIAEIDYQTWQQAWHRIVTTNLTAAANLSFCAAQKMIPRGGGRIVNVSSRGAFRGEPKMPWYGASKAGMNAMGQSLAQALGPHGVFVYTVAPGFVETEMAAKVLASPEGDDIRNQSTIGRVAQPQELGKTIAFLALEAPEFMTGCIVDVNGASYLRS